MQNCRFIRLTNIQVLFSDSIPFRIRILAISVVTVVTLGINLLGMVWGITVVMSHLLYFPILLAGYWYPHGGAFFSQSALQRHYGDDDRSLCTAAPAEGIIAASRMAIPIMIGGIISLLSWKLSESEQQLHDIIEFLPDATFAIDRDGKVIAWNRAIEEMTGKKKAEMLGRGDYEYALAFYGERRPLLAGLIIRGIPDIREKYLRDRLAALTPDRRIFFPDVRGGRGAPICGFLQPRLSVQRGK